MITNVALIRGDVYVRFYYLLLSILVRSWANAE